MKITTLLTLSFLGGVSCAQTTPPQSAVADVPGAKPAATSTDAAQTEGGAMVLISAADVKRLRENKDKFADIIQAGTKSLDYEPKPVAILAPGAHYDKNGVNPNANGDKQLSLDCGNAYRLGLCYLVTEDPLSPRARSASLTRGPQL